MPDTSPPPRLLVHVGMQKTGTSFLQSAMLRGRDSLAGAGLDLVPPTKNECFELMTVVRDRYAGRRDPESDRLIVERFTRQLHAAPGVLAVLSQESLAAAGPRQIDRLLAAADGRRVEVVVTVRDLARQLASSWQQELKAGGTEDLPTYLDRLRAMEREGTARHPWVHLDPPRVVERWASAVGADRLHVVTVPGSGSPPSLLLERFAAVLGVSPSRFDVAERAGNTSLGEAQAEVLRRVNVALPREAHRRHAYGEVVKRGFAAGVLVAQPGARRILVPERFRGWVEEVGARQVEQLGGRGHHLVGDLADLAVRPESFTGTEAGAARESEVAQSSVAALAQLLAERSTEVAARRDDRIGPRADGTDGRDVGRDDGPVHRLRRRLRR